MDFKGKIVNIYQESGTTKSGEPWHKTVFVIKENEGQYPNSICAELNRNIEPTLYKKGDDVEVSCNLYANEYNGKYYQNINIWRIKNKSKNESTENVPPIPTPCDNKDFATVHDLPFL